MSVLICPVCKKELVLDGRSVRCESGHNFDYSKDGYVNLLPGSKSGELRGDSKESARARKEFLSKDYYLCLKENIAKRLHGVVLDICCGEGYYDDYTGELYAFDISKEMVRLASKRNRAENYNYFVANLSSIPVADGSIDTAIHLFAPFNENEFFRVLSNDGVLYSVIPGENHLFEMKRIVYDKPYKNDEIAPKTEAFRLVSTTRVSDVVHISGKDLKTLFSMTPYYYRTSEADRRKLDAVDEMDLTVEFLVLEYRK